MSKFDLQHAAGQWSDNPGVLLMSWIASALVVIFVLFLVIHPLVVWMKRRRAASRPGEAVVTEPQCLVGPQGSNPSD